MIKALLGWRDTKYLEIFTDGAIRPDQKLSGVAAVVKNAQGEIIYWWGEQLGPMTNNEAEYAAVIFALKKALDLSPGFLQLNTDSRLIVDQIHGAASARSPRLRSAYLALRSLTHQFHQINFTHIPREQNRLADALANDAADGYYTGGAPYEFRDVYQTAFLVASR